MYGTHPFHWYFTAGIPAVTGMMLPLLIYDLFEYSEWNQARRKLWIIVGCYVIAHSGSSHKEFRFLLPVLPLLCLLSAPRLQELTSTLSSARRNTVLIIGGFLNFVAILYLGLFHQRAAVDVNHAILKAVRQHTTPPATATYRVHYLLGCHSTPLVSHLHSPPIQFETWYLDCSPSCRADPAVDCESDSFSRNPQEFVQQTYFECTDEDERVGSDTCTAVNAFDIRRPLPDFVVCNAENLGQIKSTLNLMGMSEIGRFVNGINGMKFGNTLTIGEEIFVNEDFTKLDILPNIVTVGLDEMILLQHVPKK